jgi:hypothetical protein
MIAMDKTAPTPPGQHFGLSRSGSIATASSTSISASIQNRPRVGHPLGDGTLIVSKVDNFAVADLVHSAAALLGDTAL